MRRLFLAQTALCLLIASCTVNEIETVETSSLHAEEKTSFLYFTGIIGY